MEGYTSDFKPVYGPEDRETILKNGETVRRVDIPEYFKNRNLIEAINFFIKYKNFGFPYSGGWGEQLNLHMDVILLLTQQDAIYGNTKMRI